MKEYSNIYARQVYQLLTPLIGDLMSQSVIRTQAKALNKTEDTLAAPDMPIIAEGARKGLNLFIGSEVSQQVTSKIAAIH